MRAPRPAGAIRVAEVFSIWDDPVYPGLLRDLRATLEPRGVEFFVITRKTEAAGRGRFVADGMTVYQVGWVCRRRWLSRLEPLVNAVLVPLQTLLVLRRERHDLVHYQFGAVDYNWLSLAAPWLRRPLLLTFHGCHVRDDSHRWYRALCRRLVRRAARISAVSSALLEEVKRLYPESAAKIELIRNGVDLEFFARGRPRLAERPYILSVGRLAEYKGHDLLLFAFLDILREGRDVDLVICGPENDEGHIRGLVAALGLRDRVRLTGTVSRGEVRDLLHGCVFMALASRREGFGLAMLESLAAGKPVVAPAADGQLEFLQDGCNGLLFAPNDIAGLRAALRRLLDDPGLRDRLGRGAAATAAPFSADAMSRRYQGWFETAVA